MWHAVMPECESNRRNTSFVTRCVKMMFFLFKKNKVLFSSLKEAEKPYCERLHRIQDLMQRSKVSIEEVISELGQYFFVFEFISTFTQDLTKTFVYFHFLLCSYRPRTFLLLSLPTY